MDVESLGNLLARPAVLAATLVSLTGVLGLALGWLAGRGRSTRLDREEQERETEARDLRKTFYLLQNENAKLTTFLMTLPDLARQLNSNLERRKIPVLLTSFIEALFDAEQILIFLTAQDGKHLTLAAAKGLSGKNHQEMIPFGSGRVGWVASHQITMDEADFDQKSRVAEAKPPGNLPAFRTELCAPMVSSSQTLGVISIGGLLRRPKNEKNMLKMVADLGSIAIQNSISFERMQSSADTDGLTGLANKRHFTARLAEEIVEAESQKMQKCLSLFLFDIDHFKTYNDTNGHLAGDEALRITGRLLDDLIRQEGLAARYGGEEFVVLLPDTDKKGATIVAEKIRKAVETYPYPQAGSQPGGRLTISGGVATCPFDARTMNDLIRCADQALYKAKREGRNRVLIHEPRYLSDETGDGEAMRIAGGQAR